MITTNNSIQTKNTSMSMDIKLAQEAMDIIKKHPQLAHCQNATFTMLKDSRSNHHYVIETFYDIIKTYGDPEYTSKNTIEGDKDIPPEVKTFFLDVHNYLNRTF